MIIMDLWAIIYLPVCIKENEDLSSEDRCKQDHHEDDCSASLLSDNTCEE